MNKKPESPGPQPREHATSESQQSSKPTIQWKRWFRIGVFSLTIAAIGYLIYKSADQFRENPIVLSQVGYHWWALAMLSYFGALLFSCLFWFRVLIALGQQPKWLDCVAAFLTSQLGKYIPGKAMVIVIRTDMIRGPNVQLKPAIASVFVETLTWIFIGSVIACLLLVVEFREQTTLAWVAILFMLVAGVLTWPPIFSAIAQRLSKLGKSSERTDLFSGLDLKTMAFGWGVMGVGWLLNGLSLWLVLKGLPGVEVGVQDYSLALACVSLATVAGFVSLMPGGLGVRELVMIPLLGPAIGASNAIVAAIVIRLVWLGAILVSAGIIYLGRIVFRCNR